MPCTKSVPVMCRAERSDGILDRAAQLRLDRAHGIVEYEMVGAACAQFAAAQARQGALLRQLPWWWMGAVVDYADDDRMVDIAVQKLHDDFLPHTRQGLVPFADPPSAS